MSYNTITVEEFSPNLTIEIPKFCPNCGVANNPTSRQIGHTVTVQNSDNQMTSFIHFCKMCDKYHITIQKQAKPTDNFVCVTSYPKGISPDIDQVLIKNAPNFVKFYSESIEAEYNGLTNLAAMGLRASVESLIKDFALKFSRDSREEIANTSFFDAIKKYIDEDDLLSGVAHFIRKVGNNYAHWDNTTDIDYATLRTYVEIIIKSFQQKFMMIDLPKV